MGREQGYGGWSGGSRIGRSGPGIRIDRQCRIRLPGHARSQPPDHPRQPDRSDGIILMKNLNILSGGAAQGLVASLASAFKSKTGFDIAGEYGVAGAIADNLLQGVPADIIIFTAALVTENPR